MVLHKLSGSSVPGGTDLEALQVWLLKLGEDSTRLSTSVEIFVDWLSKGSPPWAAYRAFMSVYLITLDKQPSMRPVYVGETFRRLFTKNLLNVTGPEATMACKDDQMYAVLKSVIDDAILRVQDLCE